MLRAEFLSEPLVGTSLELVVLGTQAEYPSEDCFRQIREFGPATESSKRHLGMLVSRKWMLITHLCVA
jgi:hypothetical protein